LNEFKGKITPPSKRFLKSGNNRQLNAAQKKPLPQGKSGLIKDKCTKS